MSKNSTVDDLLSRIDAYEEKNKLLEDRNKLLEDRLSLLEKKYVEKKHQMMNQ